MAYKKKSFLEKAFNKKVGSAKRSANAKFKKDVKNNGCIMTFLGIIGWIFIIIFAIGIYIAMTSE